MRKMECLMGTRCSTTTELKKSKKKRATLRLKRRRAGSLIMTTLPIFHQWKSLEASSLNQVSLRGRGVKN